MVESKRMGNNPDCKIKLDDGDEELSSLARQLAEKLSHGQKDFQSLGKHPVVPPLNSPLNPEDLENGSFVFLTKTGKVFFLKTEPQEWEKAKLLKDLGFRTAATYNGSLTFSQTGFYVFGRLPLGAINLSLFTLCDPKPSRFFGTFDILKEAASIAASFHNAGLVHNNFEIRNFILASGQREPLLLYGNRDLIKTDSPEERENDLNLFLSSLERTNPQCPHKKHREYFLDAYQQARKNGNRK